MLIYGLGAPISLNMRLDVQSSRWNASSLPRTGQLLSWGTHAWFTLMWESHTPHCNNLRLTRGPLARVIQPVHYKADELRCLKVAPISTTHHKWPAKSPGIRSSVHEGDLNKLIARGETGTHVYGFWRVR